jgi:hypothetical protein
MSRRIVGKVNSMPLRVTSIDMYTDKTASIYTQAPVAPPIKSQWGIHWLAPTIMLGSFALALCAAMGNHTLYTIVNDQEPFDQDVSRTQQRVFGAQTKGRESIVDITSRNCPCRCLQDLSHCVHWGILDTVDMEGREVQFYQSWKPGYAVWCHPTTMGTIR